MKPKVLISDSLSDAAIQVFKDRGVEVDFQPNLGKDKEKLAAVIGNYDGLAIRSATKVTPKIIERAAKLRVIGRAGIGVDNVDIPAATARSILIGNTPGVLTEATADIAVTLLLAATRRLGESATDAKEGRWLTWDPRGWLGQDLLGKTLGIVGMGRIGFATAKRLYGGWGMKVLYTARTPKLDADTQLGATRVELNELLEQSDFVSVHTDLNPETKGLFGAEQFRRMKRTAIFINTSRGPVVQQPALAEALRNGTIFAAGLDVTDPEPIPASSPLLTLENIIVVPHIASASAKTRARMAEMALSNLQAGLSGSRLPYCANPQVYDS